MANRITEEELQEYRKSVEFLAKNKISYAFPNSSLSHAAIIFDVIVKYSEKETRIFCRNLNGDIVKNSSFLKLLKEHVSSNKKIRFIVADVNEGELNSIQTELKSLVKETPELISVKRAGGSFMKKIKKVKGKGFYFATGDNICYRLEEEDVESQYKAVCNFNAPETTQELNKTFDISFDSLKNYF